MWGTSGVTHMVTHHHWWHHIDHRCYHHIIIPLLPARDCVKIQTYITYIFQQGRQGMWVCYDITLIIKQVEVVNKTFLKPFKKQDLLFCKKLRLKRSLQKCFALLMSSLNIFGYLTFFANNPRDKLFSIKRKWHQGRWFSFSYSLSFSLSPLPLPS